MSTNPVRNISSLESKSLTKKVQSIPFTPFLFRSIKATGSEAGIINLAKDISKIQSKINLIYYGDKTNPNKGIKFPFKKEKIDGILPLLNEINKIDFCNLVSYVLNNLQLDNNKGPLNIVGTVKVKAKELIPIIDEIILGSVNYNSNALTINDIVIITQDIALSNNIDTKGNVVTFNVNDKITIEDNNILNTLRKNPTSYVKTNNKIKQVLIKVRNQVQELSSLTEDPDVISLVPQLTQSNNFIKDFNRKLDKNISAESIPNSEVRIILNQIKQLRTILSLISGINSYRDSLGLVQTVTNLNIGEQEQRIQKYLSIDKLLPTIRTLLNSVNTINQMGLKILKFVKLILIYIKIQTVILKVLKKVVKIFNKLPLPLAFLMFGITSTIEGGKDAILKQIDERLKRLSQLNTTVELIYLTVQNITVKIQYINKQLQILQNNIQLCNQTDNSPIINELDNTRKRLINTLEDLDKFSSKYTQAGQLNENIFGGFILRIQEEVLVDEGIKYKRRRGIAIDSNGILVEQTDLTFATDISIIIEELKLKLQNKGLIQGIGDTGSQYPDLDILVNEILTDSDIPDLDQDNLSDEESTSEYIAIQSELNTVINGIKGASKLKKRVKKNIEGTISDTKLNIQNQNNIPSANGSINSILSNTTQIINTGVESATANANILSDEERIKLEQDLVKLKQLILTAGPLSIDNINIKIKVIQDKLEKDKIARGNI